METKKTTHKDLVNILSERNKYGKYDAIIERAKNKGYHDFKFDSITNHPEYGDCFCPKAQLVEDLSLFPELNAIRADVMKGVYDESPDEDDNKIMRGWLEEDGEKGERLADLLGL